MTAERQPVGTLNSVHVRKSSDEEAAHSALIGLFPLAEIDPGDELLGAVLPNDAFVPPAAELLDLSQRLQTDVIWLGFQSAVDAFQFHYWKEGRLLRSLVYGAFEEERTWERVEGEPEPWEREVLFDQQALTRRLEYVESEAEKGELERIWSAAEILPGRDDPSLDAQDCAFKVAEFYGLSLL
jgi:hypothetical protein